MLFNAYSFWLFFALVFGLYCVLTHRWQNRLLLVASYVFYGWWDYRFLSLLALSTWVDFVVGNKLAEIEDQRRRKRWLILSLVANLGLLGFFKYFNFFIDSASALMIALGFEPSTWTLKVILPVGISFYTFQTMSYTIDIYRRQLKPAKSFWDFALYVSFFPQLVAGPIERAQNLLPQVERPRHLEWAQWSQGATLMLIGLFKKVAIADTLAPMVELAFATPENASTRTLLIGLYCFSIQIYADFSGYSDIARGLAKWMGFELMENFQQPYFSGNITEFWRRWHVSLSTWLRDYLYIPLGGNRNGPAQARRNLFITMLLGGLWHGAAWTFVVWGCLHGVFLALHKGWLGNKKPPEAPPKRGLANLIAYTLKLLATFHLVALTWIFFRAETFSKAWAYLRGICSWRTDADLAGDIVRHDADEWGLALASLVVLLVFIEIPQYAKRDHTALLRAWFPLKVFAFAVLVVWIIMMRRSEYVPFLYFQF